MICVIKFDAISQFVMTDGRIAFLFPAIGEQPKLQANDDLWKPKEK